MAKSQSRSRTSKRTHRNYRNYDRQQKRTKNKRQRLLIKRRKQTRGGSSPTLDKVSVGVEIKTIAYEIINLQETYKDNYNDIDDSVIDEDVKNRLDKLIPSEIKIVFDIVKNEKDFSKLKTNDLYITILVAIIKAYVDKSQNKPFLTKKTEISLFQSFLDQPLYFDLQDKSNHISILYEKLIKLFSVSKK